MLSWKDFDLKFLINVCIMYRYIYSPISMSQLKISIFSPLLIVQSTIKNYNYKLYQVSPLRFANIQYTQHSSSCAIGMRQEIVFFFVLRFTHPKRFPLLLITLLYAHQLRLVAFIFTCAVWWSPSTRGRPDGPLLICILFQSVTFDGYISIGPIMAYV